MKKKMLALVFLFVSLGITSFVFADTIPIKGQWDDTSPRFVAPVVPAAPTASIEENTVSIYLADVVTNLTVTVYQDGEVVHSEKISAEGRGYTYDLPYFFGTGDYQIVLSHLRYGTLSGEFSVD